MARKTNVLTISLPINLAKAVDELSRETDQTRSELVRNALREHILDSHEDRQRFLTAYKATRNEKTINIADLKKKYDL